MASAPQKKHRRGAGLGPVPRLNRGLSECGRLRCAPFANRECKPGQARAEQHHRSWFRSLGRKPVIGIRHGRPYEVPVGILGRYVGADRDIWETGIGKIAVALPLEGVEDHPVAHQRTTKIASRVGEAEDVRKYAGASEFQYADITGEKRDR